MSTTTSIEQKPNLLSAVNTPLIYVLKDSDAANYNANKFRYVLKIKVNTVEIAVLKIHKNQQNVGVFDISHILKTYVDTQLTNTSYVTTTESIHTLGIFQTNSPFCQNTNQLAKINVEAYYEKASSATTAPALSAVQDTAESYVIPAATPFTKTAANVGGLDISGTNYPLTFFMNSTTSEDSCTFFTNAPTVQFVRGSSTSADNIDRATICFKSGKTGTGILNQGAAIDYILIKYYDSAGNVITNTAGNTLEYFANTNTTGGASAAQATTVEEAILYFGCGTENLETQTRNSNAKPSKYSNWAYYKIFGSDTTAESGRSTKEYYFYRYGTNASVDDRHQSCTRYNNVRLAWRNRLGAWDYMNFRGKSTESVEIKSEEMERVVGNWDNASATTEFNYSNWERGRETLFTKAKRKLVINSDWLNEDEAVWLEELFTSVNVQILGDNGVVYPVIITNKLYTKKTSVNNKIKIQYTVNLEYSNEVRTNS